MDKYRTDGTLKKNFSWPDVVRHFEKGSVEIVCVGGTSVARMKLEPGWRWSTHVRPLVNTPSCRQEHCQYVISGRLKVALDDGRQLDLRPGDIAVVPPGHDAWVEGDEPYVAIDMTGLTEYAVEAAEACPAAKQL
jgi:quercetin dioxygenase-like cupin family protein